jgi:Zn-dependent protease with chaperone function
VREYPLWELKGTSARLLPTSIPFVARVGFWRSELVVSQGVLDALDADHLEAVLTHEQAHHYYRDTFWFFWLGWLRRLTFWLPQTEILWQELLLLREHRADCWAAQSVDTLLLAESLVQMVSAPTLYSEIASVAFSNALPHNRLEERIEVLLSQPKPLQQTGLWIWAWLVSGFLPLLVVPFHY